MNDKPRFRVVGDDEMAPAPEKETTPRTFEDLDLKDTQYGDDLLGILTDDQADRFVRIYDINAEIRALNNEVGGAMFEALGRDVRAGKLDNAEAYEMGQNVDPALMRRYFQLEAEKGMLQSQFFYELGEQFGTHDHKMMIRSKRRVVKRERKF